MIVLQLVISRDRLERPWLHFFRAVLKFLNLADKVLADESNYAVDDQQLLTVSKKPWCSTPEVLEFEYIGARDTGTNGHFTWDVIGGDFG